MGGSRAGGWLQGKSKHWFTSRVKAIVPVHPYQEGEPGPNCLSTLPQPGTGQGTPNLSKSYDASTEQSSFSLPRFPFLRFDALHAALAEQLTTVLQL